MSSQSPDYIPFLLASNTLRYQHAVNFCSRKLLHRVMKILIHGNINNIRDCVRNALGSITQYRNTFTKEEQRVLEVNDHKVYDLPLLYKVICKVCGLDFKLAGPVSLESSINTVRGIWSELLHDSMVVLTDEQLSEKLSDLINLSEQLMSTLGERAQELGKHYFEEEIAEVLHWVQGIISDVKESQSFCIPDYIPFVLKTNTLRSLHSVKFCSQKLFHFVLKTLIPGDINNITGLVRKVYGANTNLSNLFTTGEQNHLELNDHTFWNSSLLYKVIQMVCCLAPAGSGSLSTSTSDHNSLESLLCRMKDISNQTVHNFSLVLTEDQLSDNLDSLLVLSIDLLSALRERAPELDKQCSETDIAETIVCVHAIIFDAKGEVISTSRLSDRQQHFWDSITKKQ